MRRLRILYLIGVLFYFMPSIGFCLGVAITGCLSALEYILSLIPIAMLNSVLLVWAMAPLRDIIEERDRRTLT